MNKSDLKKKFVLGTANFTQKYGVKNTKVNLIEIKKILNLAKKNNLNTLDTADSYLNEFIGMTSYGIFALILIKIGRFVHDRLALNKFDKNEQIKARNISVGIVDAGAVVATAIIIRAILLWVEGLDINTFIAITAGFVVSQTMLILITRIKEREYAKNNQGSCMQQALVDGQVAIAIRYVGQVISTALAVTAASHFLIYSPETLLNNLVGWFLFSIVMTLLVSILTAIAKRLVLMGINLVEEVDQQHNIGVAFVEIVISISIALILTALMS